MKKKAKIFFRADGNSTIGLGHVIRSLAFAEMVHEYFDCHFVIQNPTPALQSQIQNVCDHLIILEKPLSIIQEAEYLRQNWIDDDSIVVLDGYAFDTDYQKVMKSSGCKLICIDDINAYHFLADVVINHAGGFSVEEYSVETGTKVLLGPSYALLRPEFQQAAKTQSSRTDSDSIFICLGGADPKNDTIKVLKECLIHRPNASFQIVLGSAYLHWETLESFIYESSAKVQVSKNLNAQEMADLMQQCPIAITSPSTVAYEYLCTGGKLFLKVIADNQKRINEYLITNKIAFGFDDFPQFDQLIFNTTLQDSLFDGNQKKRFLKLLFALKLTLEIATKNDMELYFNWANDPKTRSQSFQSDPIKWEDHKVWFSKRVQSESHVFYKAMISNIPVGQIRYDFNQKEALINYSVDANFRGFGIGSLMIQNTLPLISSYFKGAHDVVGYVKYENIASSKVFSNLGFQRFDASKYINTYKYILKCKT